MLPGRTHLLARLCAGAALAATLLLGACGGGGGGDDAPALAATPASDLPPPSTLAGICTPEGEKQFVRSYLNEVYLWYDEVPAVDSGRFASARDYFNALLVRTPDASGKPKDRFSAVLTTAGADALQSTLLTTPPTASVPLSRIIDSPGGRKVGYVLFNNHDIGAQDTLIAIFGELRAAAVQDLVLDLRFNTGGYLYVARTLASMVTGPQNTNKVFEQLRYNNKRTAESNAGTYFFNSRVESGERRFPQGTELPQLSLPRLYVLNSGLTCSASESVINSLRGIDVEVVLVGSEPTCGKPFGFRRKDNCGLAYFPIEFQGYNAKGFGDFTEGFAPTCNVREDRTAALGGTDEPLLAAALHHVDTGACPAVGSDGVSKGLLAQDAAAAPRSLAPTSSRPFWAGKLLAP